MDAARTIAYFSLSTTAFAFALVGLDARAAEPASGIVPISGIVKVAPAMAKALKEAGSGGALFIIARKGAGAGGPPLAAKRISPASFPQAFTIGASDMMMASGAFEGPLQISAKYSRRGDAMTSSGDFLAEPKTGLAPGAKDVVLTLDKQAK